MFGLSFSSFTIETRTVLGHIYKAESMFTLTQITEKNDLFIALVSIQSNLNL